MVSLYKISEVDSQIIVYKLKIHQTTPEKIEVEPEPAFGDQEDEPIIDTTDKKPQQQSIGGKTYIYVADVMKSLTIYAFNPSFAMNRLSVNAWHASG
jgi:hypothetical protein